MGTGFPQGFLDVIERCLAKDPAQRFASTQALLAALEPLSRVPASLSAGGLSERRPCGRVDTSSS